MSAFGSFFYFEIYYLIIHVEVKNRWLLYGQFLPAFDVFKLLNQRVIDARLNNKLVCSFSPTEFSLFDNKLKLSFFSNSHTKKQISTFVYLFDD